MRKIGLILAAAALTPLTVRANGAYDFSTVTAGTVPASNAAADSSVKFLGTTTLGEIATAQDNWVFTSGTVGNGIIVRNDAKPGMTGNWVSAYPSSNVGTTAPANYDAIHSRVNAGGANYGLQATGVFTVSYIASLSPITYNNASNVATTANSRSIVGIGYDQNSDGDIRGNPAVQTNENAEWGPMFGYDSNGNWTLRPASLGTAVNTAAGSLSGAWLVQLTVDNTTSTNGVGTLSVQQLFDASGAAVSDTLHAVVSNVVLNLNGMTTVSNGGTPGGSNPANWNGFFVRATNNGGVDNFAVTQTPEPTTLAVLGLAGVGALARRRRA